MLNNLVRINRKRKTIGRGGDHGGTSGYGTKGQRARSGGRIRTQFEGGQTPLTRRLPKRGFSNKGFSNEFTIISLENIQTVFDKTNSLEINKESLLQCNFIKNLEEKVKVLAAGELKNPVIVSVERCSEKAEELIVAAGGKFISTAPTEKREFNSDGNGERRRDFRNNGGGERRRDYGNNGGGERRRDYGNNGGGERRRDFRSNGGGERRRDYGNNFSGGGRRDFNNRGSYRSDYNKNEESNKTDYSSRNDSFDKKDYNNDNE